VSGEKRREEKRREEKRREKRKEKRREKRRGKKREEKREERRREGKRREEKRREEKRRTPILLAKQVFFSSPPPFTLGRKQSQLPKRCDFNFLIFLIFYSSDGG
jgi:hypothetical protein